MYEYNSKDLIGHGAFAVVYRGRVRMVSHVDLYSQPSGLLLLPELHVSHNASLKRLYLFSENVDLFPKRWMDRPTGRCMWY